MRSVPGFLAAALLLAAAARAQEGDVSLDEFVLSRSRLGGSVTGEGILVWTGDLALDSAEVLLAVLDEKGGRVADFPPVRVGPVAAGRAARFSCEGRGVAEFAAYEVEVRFAAGGRERSALFEGAGPESPPVRRGSQDGDPPRPAGRASLSVESVSLADGAVRCRVVHAGGPAARGIHLEVVLLSPAGARLASRVLATGKDLAPGEALAVRIPVEPAQDAVRAQVRALATRSVVPIPSSDFRGTGEVPRAPGTWPRK
ncbi:MAG: hypothetical protein HY720_16610 [Planctomycetes bacterium]|nr:hypothetical protein [Planctomycetota bacterium]